MNPREQGDVGERSAVEWLWSQGYAVFVPFGHSPDVDLIAVRDDETAKVQVKTCNYLDKGRWCVAVCTRGGNQSWSGIVKRFEARRCDRLFVLTGDGRRWWIPSAMVEGGTAIRLGGPKYAKYEVGRGRPFASVSLP